MSTVIKPNPKVWDANTPVDLRELPGWLLWKAGKVNDKGKFAKVPHYASGSKRQGTQKGTPAAVAADRAKLVTFTKARAAQVLMGQRSKSGEDMVGIGLALIPDWHITALDFDHCLDDAGNWLPGTEEIQHIVSMTYAEMSPSGTGVRAFVRGDLGDLRSHTDEGWPYGFDTFNTYGFVTITGEKLKNCGKFAAEGDVDEAFEAARLVVGARLFAQEISGPRSGKKDTGNAADALAKHSEKVNNLTYEQMRAYLYRLDPNMRREPWRNVGMAWHHQFDGSDEAFEEYHEWSIPGRKYAGREDVLTQWKSFKDNRNGGKSFTFRTIIDMVQSGKPDIVMPSEVSGIKPLAEYDTNRRRNSAEYSGDMPILGAPTFVKKDVWLIHKVLQKGKLGMVVGPPGAGKTFLSLDMAFAIGRGVPWHDHKTTKMRILYIAAEGQSGLDKRVLGYYIENKLQPGSDQGVDFLLTGLNVCLKSDRDKLRETIEDVTKKFGKYDLIFFDTLHRVAGGTDENSAQDARNVIDGLESIAADAGAMGIVVHHTGKDASKGARGSTAYLAALDAQILIDQDAKTGVITMLTTKQKDTEAGYSLRFELKACEVPVIDAEPGDPPTMTATVKLTDRVPMAAPEKRGEKIEGRRLGVVERRIADFAEGYLNAGTVSMLEADFRQECLEAIRKDQKENSGRVISKHEVYDAITNLATKKPILYKIAHGRILFD